MVIISNVYVRVVPSSTLQEVGILWGNARTALKTMPNVRWAH